MYVSTSFWSLQRAMRVSDTLMVAHPLAPPKHIHTLSVLSELTETSEHHTAHSPAANPARSTSGSQHLRWQLGPSLGQGAFAEVFQGIDTETGKFLAVKQIKLKKEGCAAAKALRREIDMMIHMPSHRNVVKYLGTEQTKDRLFIFLEYISGGSIAAMLEKFGALAESIVSRYTHELLCGLDFLHTSSIVHCDIKGANLLVSEDGIVKLADFNSSKFLVDIPLSGAQHDLRSIAGTPQVLHVCLNTR
jgi:serine/threonine protein kinase